MAQPVGDRSTRHTKRSRPPSACARTPRASNAASWPSPIAQVSGVGARMASARRTTGRTQEGWLVSHCTRLYPRLTDHPYRRQEHPIDLEGGFRMKDKRGPREVARDDEFQSGYQEGSEPTICSSTVRTPSGGGFSWTAGQRPHGRAYRRARFERRCSQQYKFEQAIRTGPVIEAIESAARLDCVGQGLGRHQRG